MTDNAQPSDARLRELMKHEEAAWQQAVAAERAESQDKAQAVFYIEAVRAGQIEDSAPVKIVSTLYGVHRRTIQKWLKYADKIIKGIPRPSGGSVRGSMSAARRITRKATTAAGWIRQRPGRTRTSSSVTKRTRLAACAACRSASRESARRQGKGTHQGHCG
jgi:hypothetical protein